MLLKQACRCQRQRGRRSSFITMATATGGSALAHLRMIPVQGPQGVIGQAKRPPIPIQGSQGCQQVHSLSEPTGLRVPSSGLVSPRRQSTQDARNSRSPSVVVRGPNGPVVVAAARKVHQVHPDGQGVMSALGARSQVPGRPTGPASENAAVSSTNPIVPESPRRPPNHSHSMVSEGL